MPINWETVWNRLIRFVIELSTFCPCWKWPKVSLSHSIQVVLNCEESIYSLLSPHLLIVTHLFKRRNEIWTRPSSEIGYHLSQFDFFNVDFVIGSRVIPYLFSPRSEKVVPQHLYLMQSKWWAQIKSRFLSYIRGNQHTSQDRGPRSVNFSSVNYTVISYIRQRPTRETTHFSCT